MPALSRKTYILGGVAAAVALIVVVCFAWANSVQKRGTDLETQLNALYLNNQNTLSAQKATVLEDLGVADRASDKLDAVLTDAIKGRYDTGSTAQPVGGAAFSAMVEAYPQLSSIPNAYSRVMDAITSGRQAFKDGQSDLLDHIRSYDNWRHSGLLHQMMVSMVGFPSSNLEARIGTQVLTGQAALDQMKLIVTTSDTKQAFQTGNDQPLNTNPSPGH